MKVNQFECVTYMPQDKEKKETATKQNDDNDRFSELIESQVGVICHAQV